ncbi:unnamed protein product [Vicia faba]|uniref:Galectin n=1 Tax=Vicia faba TaxID=3906 RepID=A0AAV1A627_VICFA|nr:unnamed protein product [Vicia faba]
MYLQWNLKSQRNHQQVWHDNPNIIVHIDCSSHKQEVVIEGKIDGQVGGPPNIEQPTLVQTKKLKKNSDYDIILPIGVPSHIYRVLINQKHDIVFGEADIGVPLTAGGNVIDVTLMFGPIRGHHVIQKSFGEMTHKPNVDKYVPNILSGMLIESQIHKENGDVTPENNFVSDNDHIHEDVEVDTILTHSDVVNNHD